MPAPRSLRPAAGVVQISPGPLSGAADIDIGDGITIAPLPEFPEPPAGSGWTAALPALGAVGMSAYALLSGRLLVILLGVAGSAAAVVVAVTTRRGSVRRWRQTCQGRRTRYLEHLDACRRQAMAAAQRQRALARQRFPAPDEPPRRWQGTRREIRLGLGRVPLHPPLRPPTPPHPSALPWPELAAALADFVGEFSTVDDCPVTLDLSAAGPLGLVGSARDSRALVRAIRLQVPDLQVFGPSDPDVESGLPSTCTPVVVLAETVDELPAGVRTVGTWNSDGSLTLRAVAFSPAAAAGRRVVAQPDRLSEADAERLLAPSDTTVPRVQLRHSGGVPSLGVVLGTSETGDPVVLDLAESAQGGDGPHGWVVGATGTGKSQLLRRLVLDLAVRRSPADVAFVLVDFKGGAAFDDLAALPHVAGVLTNLDDSHDHGDVLRLIDALQAEIRRRQRALRTAAVPDLRAYSTSSAQPEHEPMPHLVVVVDEAAELLGSCPEVLDTFATIGRVGRSLGIHLVLAAQRPEEARLRSLEGALRFRICLRTLTTADSIAVVRDPGAAGLPAEPGWALLAVDAAPRRFRVTPVHAVPTITEATRTRPVWHAPLPATVTMPLPVHTDAELAPALTVLIGLADAPQAQWQAPLSIALDGAAGHLAVIGAPRTGRTSALRTVAVNLAAIAAPSRLHLYAIGSAPALAGLSTLPHTGAVVHPTDVDLVLDVVGTVAALVASRQRQAADRVRPLHRPADVVLFIDDWPQLRAALPDLEPVVQEIAASGLAVGIHLVLTAHRWSDLRAALRDCIGSRLELHLPDPLESLRPRGVPGPPPGRPGRCLLLAGQLPEGQLPEAEIQLPLPLHLQLADMAPHAEATINERWSSQPAPVRRIHPLPPIAVRPRAPASPQHVLGVGSGGPVIADLNTTDQHLLIVGDPGSGRSTALAAVGSALAEADCWRIDPRGSLAAATVGAQQAARTPRQIDTMLADLQAELLATLNGERPAHRTLLIIDDLDVAIPLTSPGGWSGIATLLPLAADLQLTVAVARRCAGMARATYEPFLGALRDAGATGVLLSGSPDEGPILGGVRCRPGPVGRALLVRAGQPPRPLQLYADPPRVSRHVSGL